VHDHVTILYYQFIDTYGCQTWSVTLWEEHRLRVL